MFHNRKALVNTFLRNIVRVHGPWKTVRDHPLKFVGFGNLSHLYHVENVLT